ncbi:hypothetical protein O181_027718, partial [Austropuccinia psidii MF-1]|nr:hypothetical protein [Austropuccinia psidii MF-1]
MKPKIVLGLFSLARLKFCACPSLPLEESADNLGKVSHNVAGASRIGGESQEEWNKSKFWHSTRPIGSDVLDVTIKGDSAGFGMKPPKLKPKLGIPNSFGACNLFCLGKLKKSQKDFPNPKSFETEFKKLENVEDKVRKLQTIFQRLNDPIMKHSKQEKWAKTFSKIMDAETPELKEPELEVEMQVQLLDSQIFAKRIAATTSQSLDTVTPFTKLQERLMNRLKENEDNMYLPLVEECLDNVLLFPLKTIEKILMNEAPRLLKGNPLLGPYFGTLTSAQASDEDFKNAWHQVAEFGMSSNADTLTRQKVAAVSLLSYAFEVATKDGPDAPKAQRAVKEMEAIVKNDNLQKNFMSPIRRKLISELAHYRADWNLRITSDKEF